MGEPLSSQGLYCGGSAYALVRLNGDAHHVPLPREGHLIILVGGGTNSATCRQVSQLEICQLLSSCSQVIYVVGLNGCEVPVIASPPKSLAKGTNLFGGEPIYLRVDIPQSIVEGQNSRCHPLVVTPPPSWLQAPLGLLYQRQKERSAWPWRWGSSYPGWDKTHLDMH